MLIYVALEVHSLVLVYSVIIQLTVNVMGFFVRLAECFET